MSKPAWPAAPRRLFSTACVIGALMFMGCTVDQNKEVATYRAILDEHAPASVAPPASEEPLSLQHAFFLANQNDEQLSIRGETYLQSLISRARAAAGFLPSFDASARYSLSGEGSTADDSFSASAGGSITLFNLRTLSSLEQARTAVEQQELVLRDLQQTVLIGVAQSFFEVLRSAESVRVLENSLSLRGEQVRDVQARTDLGIARPLDLAQAQADESSTRVSLLQARSNARQARTTLAFLLGLEYVDNPLADDFTPGADTRTALEFEQAAIDHRLDLAAARTGVQLASQSVTAAYRQYYPTANLNLSFLLYSNPGDGNPWSLGASLLQPIFNAGLTHQDVRDAYSGLRQAVLQQDRLARQVHEDVMLAYEDYTTSTAKLQELEITVEAAQRAYDQAVGQYRVGNATNLDQLLANDQLLQAQLQLINERYNRKLFYLNLLRVTGQLQLTTPSSL
jgi:outer membrane protein